MSQSSRFLCFALILAFVPVHAFALEPIKLRDLRALSLQDEYELPFLTELGEAWGDEDEESSIVEKNGVLLGDERWAVFVEEEEEVQRLWMRYDQRSERSWENGELALLDTVAEGGSLDIEELFLVDAINTPEGGILLRYNLEERDGYRGTTGPGREFFFLLTKDLKRLGEVEANLEPLENSNSTCEGEPFLEDIDQDGEYELVSRRICWTKRNCVGGEESIDCFYPELEVHQLSGEEAPYSEEAVYLPVRGGFFLREWHGETPDAPREVERHLLEEQIAAQRAPLGLSASNLDELKVFGDSQGRAAIFPLDDPDRGLGLMRLIEVEDRLEGNAIEVSGLVGEVLHVHQAFSVESDWNWRNKELVLELHTTPKEENPVVNGETLLQGGTRELFVFYDLSLNELGRVEGWSVGASEGEASCLAQVSIEDVNGDGKGDLVSRRRCRKICEEEGGLVECGAAFEEVIVESLKPAEDQAPPASIPAVDEVVEIEDDKPFLVIAASYPRTSHGEYQASVIANDLQREGHLSAAVFDSQRFSELACCYYTVVAERCADKESCDALAKEIGEDAYVKQGFFLTEPLPAEAREGCALVDEIALRRARGYRQRPLICDVGDTQHLEVDAYNAAGKRKKSARLLSWPASTEITFGAPSLAYDENQDAQALVVRGETEGASVIVVLGGHKSKPALLHLAIVSPEATLAIPGAAGHGLEVGDQGQLLTLTLSSKGKLQVDGSLPELDVDLEALPQPK